MNMNRKRVSRRQFLKLAALGLGTLGLRPWSNFLQMDEFPQYERLGRAFNKVVIKSRPDVDADTVGVLYDDAVVPWLREVVGRNPHRFRQRWVETPDGYVWGSELQPVRNQLNQPVESLPQTSLGQGMWVEVSVPYVDILLDHKPKSPRFRNRTEAGMSLRLYYSQILWVDQIKRDDEGNVWYRANERYGYGDLMWARAEAFRPLTPEETTPISPGVEDKRVVINVDQRYQTLSCYEGNSEVYFCRISGGQQYDADGKFLGHSSTPTGTVNIWRKLFSTHMSGGSIGTGYDLPGIGWTVLFTANGVAIHSTFWHNNFGGELMSHGCINAAPEDAKWIFRWTNPPVLHDPGELYSKDTDIPPSKVTVLEG